MMMMMTMMSRVIMMMMNITTTKKVNTKMYFTENVRGKNETDSFNPMVSTLAHPSTVNNKKMVKLTCLS